MIPLARWTTRSFTHELPLELFPAVLERLRGTPARAADLLTAFAEPLRLWQPDAASRPRRITRDVLMGMATTPESTALSKDLRKRGWTFVGPTTIYAFMQSVGLVNDHVDECAFRETRRRGR